MNAMFRKLLSSLMAAAIIGGPWLHAEEAPASLPQGYLEVGSDKVEALRRLCRAAAETGLFSGAVLVADQGEVIYREAFGLANREWGIPNTIDTKFRLASVSKPFCATLVMQLVQEGTLSLDDTISDHLDWYREDTGRRITLHHLLAHQSGIPDFTARFDYRGTVSKLSFDPDDFIREHCSGDLLHEPGTIYAYCNAGYVILGRIIEKATRQSFERNLEERIFGPLGMKDSGYDRNRTILEKRASGYTRGPFGYTNAEYMEMDASPGAAGSLYSTVEDLFLWDRALHADRLLEKNYRDLMFTPNRDVPEVKAAGGRPQSRYGYGWNIYTRTHPVTGKRTRIVNHGGAINGFRAMMDRLVEDDAFVVVLCNQGDAPGESEVWRAVVNLSTELGHIVTGQPYRMPGKPRPTQARRMYEMVKAEGVEAAIAWFEAKGKKAAWGGSNVVVADRLLEEGRVDEGLRLLEFDLEATPGKPWLLRKIARACLENGRMEKALAFAERGLELKPDDEEFPRIRKEAMRETEAEGSGASVP